MFTSFTDGFALRFAPLSLKLALRWFSATGTFVVEANIFENLRHGVGIRDGSGIIKSNLFRNLRTITDFRTLVGISISYGTHNNIPVDGCMPHDITLEGNIFSPERLREMENAKYKKYKIGKAENITIDGTLLPETKTARKATPLTIPRLQEM